MTHELLYLLKRVRSEIANDEEYTRLLELIRLDEKGASVQLVQTAYGLNNEEWTDYSQEEMSILFNQILLSHRQAIEKPLSVNTPNNYFIKRRTVVVKTLRWASVAAIIISISIGAYLWNQKLKVKNGNLKINLSENNILPGGNKATLTLSDGRTIILNAASNGQLATQQGSTIIKKDGQIIYSGNLPIPFLSPEATRGVAPGAANSVISKSYPGAGGGSSSKNGKGISFNTMSTPRGGQYKLILSDGTKVWLNAASSITYPTVFTNKAREVKISGEVYFEVAPNKSQPFIVKTIQTPFLKMGQEHYSPFEKGGVRRPGEFSPFEKERDIERRGISEIIVLGTSFNINNYPDEPYPKATLINGSIKVRPFFIHQTPKPGKNAKTTNDQEKLLKPGQAYTNGKVIETNVQQDIAWKNGIFNFNNVTLAEVARQLSRWYDVEFIYPPNLANRKFGGEIGRNLTLSEALDLINGVDVKLRLEGRKVIITP